MPVFPGISDPLPCACPPQRGACYCFEERGHVLRRSAVAVTGDGPGSSWRRQRRSPAPSPVLLALTGFTATGKRAGERISFDVLISRAHLSTRSVGKRGDAGFFFHCFLFRHIPVLYFSCPVSFRHLVISTSSVTSAFVARILSSLLLFSSFFLFLSSLLSCSLFFFFLSFFTSGLSDSTKDRGNIVTSQYVCVCC